MTCATCQHFQGERCARGRAQDDVPWECGDYTPDCGGCNALEAYRREVRELRAQLEGLTAERDHFRVGMSHASEAKINALERAERAEAEVKRLREGIAEAIDAVDIDQAGRLLRALLENR